MWPNPDDPYEPKWLEEDRAWAIALTLEENETCAGCHQPVDECTDPRNEFGAYQANVWKCHACTAKDAKDTEYAQSDGAYYATVRRL